MSLADAVNKGEGDRSYSPQYRWYVVLLLTLAYTMYTADRILLGVLLEPIKTEFGASDSQMGFVSLMAASTYALSIIPLGLLADRVNRRNLLFIILSGWSIMTAVSGFAKNLIHLAVAQMLVTTNEGGGAPTMNSLISDLFERSKRGLPISIWYCGISMGAFIGFSLGGFLADSYGWRITFILLGAPGALIALIVLLTIRETPRGMSDQVAPDRASRPDFAGTVDFLKRQKALRHAIYAQCLSGLSFMGPIAWLVSFFHRSHDASFALAGFVTGLIFLTTGLSSGPAGGFLMDHLGRKDVRWHGWLCALLMVSGGLFFGSIYLVPSLLMAFVAVAVWQLLTNAVSPITVAMISNLAPAHFRGLSLSLGFLLFHLFGFGLGSQLIGLVSDWLANERGLNEADALRYACMVPVIFHLWAAWHFRIVARNAPDGYRRAAAMEQSAPPSGAEAAL
ncbi:spinster family MFS transporter [Sphingobium sp. CAP-1]|uniref:spinster family MFS transporter n=1 Tax=Sphingobium sp. CAP-1 TaxID=2676077 RepID=UPI0012BB41D7|nr:MFS transporter [Sphingobium sp. CAP-1]QGP80432.1 MFS transporter [Sphingobium sp. CAP-1]